jgi:hypothetical protein
LTGKLNIALKDKRQKFVTKKLVIKQILPYETFILINSENFCFFTNYLGSPFLLNLVIDIRYYYFMCLYLNTELDCVYFPLELSVFLSSRINSIDKFTGSMLLYGYFRFTSLRFHFFFYLNDLKSITSLYKGYIWVEREIAEFTNVIITGLLDNRKLLTNYLQLSKFDHYCSDRFYNFDSIVHELY